MLSVPTHSAYTRGKHCLDAAVKDYTKCMLAANSPHANGATDACRGKLSLQMQSCGIATNHHSVTQMQNKAVEMHVGACRIRRDSPEKCAHLYQILRAKGASQPTVTQQKKQVYSTSERIVSQFISECTKAAEHDRMKIHQCHKDASEKLRLLYNRTLSQPEVRQEIDNGALEEIGELLYECIVNSEASEKDSCGMTGEILEACKAARGDVQCSPQFISHAREKYTNTRIQEMMKACTSEATNEAEKKECRNSQEQELKKTIADINGKDPNDAKDSSVHKAIRRGGNENIMVALKSCEAKTDAQKEQCEDQIKKAISEAEGRDPSKITKYELETRQEQVRAKFIHERMHACRLEAGEDTDKMKMCHNSFVNALKESKLVKDNKDVSEEEVERLKEQAAIQAAKEALSQCEDGQRSSAECDNKASENIEISMGNDKVSQLEKKRIMQEAALEEALEDVKACIRAKEDKYTATCRDSFSTFMDFGGYPKVMCCKALIPSCLACEEHGKRVLRTHQERFVKTILSREFSKAHRVCIKKEREEQSLCVNAARAEINRLMKHLLPREDESTIKDQQDKMERDTAIKAVGENFRLCMKIAGKDATKRAQCETVLREEKEKIKSMMALETTVSASDIKKKAYVTLIKSPGESCEPNNMEECRAKAKEEALSTGLNKRKYGQTKEMASIKGASDTFAACTKAGNQWDDCMIQGMEKYTQVSGVTNHSDTQQQEVREKLQRLGTLMASGNATRYSYKKKIRTALLIGSPKCTHALLQKIKTHLKAVIKEIRTLRGFKEPRCRIVDGNVEIITTVGTTSETTIEEDSDRIVALSEGKTFVGQRRSLLSSTVVDAYASQAVSECGVGDSKCESDEPITENVEGDDDGSDTHTPISHGCSNGGCCAEGTEFVNGRCTVSHKKITSSCRSGHEVSGQFTCESLGMPCGH